MTGKVPKKFNYLFWDINPQGLEADVDRDYVLGRILEYGTLESVRWALRTYGFDGIADFLKRRGWKVLSGKTLSFWKLILNLENEPCLRRRFIESRRPFWKY